MSCNTGTGIVIQTTGSKYVISDLQDGRIIVCRMRGKLRLKGVRSTNPVVVGDVVHYECDAVGETFITGVSERRNYVIRRSSNLSKESHIIAANLDCAILVVSLFSPSTSYEFIDRFLVTCQAYNVPAVIVLNKIDLAREYPDAISELHRTYALAGYRVLEVSALTGEGIDTLNELLRDSTTLLSGNSGVGKSTLIKAIEPMSDVRTGEISTSHNKGKHTTTHSTLYMLANGGRLIDTPGIKGFGLIDINAKELYRYFPEMLKYSSHCQFYNCTHTHEPGCAVCAALERGDISAIRYDSYCKILQEDDKYRK